MTTGSPKLFVLDRETNFTRGKNKEKRKITNFDYGRATVRADSRRIGRNRNCLGDEIRFDRAFSCVRSARNRDSSTGQPLRGAHTTPERVSQWRTFGGKQLRAPTTRRGSLRRRYQGRSTWPPTRRGPDASLLLSSAPTAADDTGDEAVTPHTDAPLSSTRRKIDSALHRLNRITIFILFFHTSNLSFFFIQNDNRDLTLYPRSLCFFSITFFYFFFFFFVNDRTRNMLFVAKFVSQRLSMPLVHSLVRSKFQSNELITHREHHRASELP